MLKHAFIFLLLFISCGNTSTKQPIEPTEEQPETIQARPVFAEQFDETTIDAELAKMSLDEKIGQLFWMAAFSNKGQASVNETAQIIKQYNVGGVTWFRARGTNASPELQLKYTNQLQAASKYPLIISIDGEWGLNMRLNQTVKFPRQLVLGAIQDNTLVEEFGDEVGRQMKRMGVHVNFAPVVDVNNNPNNPVINDRSFGEDKYNVAAKGVAYMKGMHKSGILATAKHFPGHGDTSTDSHKDLPVIYHDKYRLDDIEFYPFKELIRERVGAVMVAHLSIPAIDPTPNQPSSLSKTFITDVLQNELGFDGLIITDALNMQGVAKHYPAGQAEVQALKAGNDILLYPRSVPTGFKAVKNAVLNGEISEERINKSVRKVLATKRWLGILNGVQQISTENLIADLNQPKVHQLNKKLYENAITLVRNQQYQLPFTDLSSKTIATVSIDNGKRTTFQSALAPYAPMQHFSISSSASSAEFNSLLQKLQGYNTIIVGLNNKSRYASKEFGVSSASVNFINQINNEGKLILSVFGNPYSLEKFSHVQTLICGYNSSKEAQQSVAEAIFGVTPFKGTLPIGVTNAPAGTGELTQSVSRLKYTSLESLGYNRNALYKVDSIANAAIAMKATPGCQILVAKDGQVIYNKAFGYHTYAKKRKVKTTDLYDIASISKIAGTMPLVMEAYENGFLNVNQTLADLEPQLLGTDKQGMLVGEVLSHTAGLKSWVPFYKHTLTSAGNLNNQYRTTDAQGYQEVAKNIFIKKNYETDSMFQKIIATNNNTKGTYVYSDLGYYIFKRYFESLHNQPMEDYLDQNFYRKMGFPSLTYNPLNKFSATKITPSEQDNYYRKQEIRGYVHDMGAAMQGGVGGHAGLFANTNDLAIYMQMLLNKGSYGGVQYFNPSTVDYFTQQYNFNSRRALGFDKPETDPSRSGPTCYYVSQDSFGHTGFTGTYAWADPANDIIFIFLSNRTYPTMKNKKLITKNIRTEMQEAIWRALDPTCKPYRYD